MKSFLIKLKSLKNAKSQMQQADSFIFSVICEVKGGGFRMSFKDQTVSPKNAKWRAQLARNFGFFLDDNV